MVETERSAKVGKYAFYTHTPEQQFSPFGEQAHIADSLRDSKAFNGLVQKCLTPFQSSTRPKDQWTRVFTDGGKSHLPTDLARDQFLQEARNVVASYCGDLLLPDGTVNPDRRDHWHNVISIAPELITILTGRETYVHMVHQQHALNVVGLALEKARHPDRIIEFRVAMGASDDTFTPARLPSYVLPAVEMHEQVTAFYERRKQTVLQRAAGRRGIELYEMEHQVELSRQDKQAFTDQIQPLTDGSYPYISEGEEELLLTRASVPNGRPSEIRFVFTYNSAKSVNHSRDPKRIDERTAANVTAIQTYIDTYHPTIADDITYTPDRMWDTFDIHEETVHEYMAHMLQTSDDPQLQEALRVLRARGRINGGDNGARNAAKYAAMHPAFFANRMNLPYMPYLAGVTMSDQLVVTIGGRTERYFLAMQEYLSQNANPEGLKAYIAEKATTVEDDDRLEAAKLWRMYTAIERWERMIAKKRARYPEDTTSIARPDLPIHEVPFISHLAYRPPYYATEFDIPAGVDLDHHAADVEAKIVDLKAQRAALKGQPGAADRLKRVHDRIELAQGVLFDVNAMQSDISRHQEIEESILD